MRIAFGHKARCGKDLACDKLRAKYGGTTLRFAEKLYEVVGLVQETLGFEVKKDRELLTGMADLIKKKDYNIFVRHIERKIGETQGNIFIADLRFKNEAEMLKKQGFTLVKIARSNSEESKHVSEHELDDYDGWDYTIANDGTIEEFTRDILLLADFLRSNLRKTSK